MHPLLIYLPRAILYCFMSYYFFTLISCFIAIKPHKSFKFIALGSFTLICPVVIYNYDTVNIFFTMLAFFAVMLSCFKGSRIKQLSMVLIFYPIIVAINFLTLDIIGYVPIIRTSEFFYQLFRTLNDVLILLFWRFVYHCLKDKITQNAYIIEDKMWLLIDIICTTPFISIYLAIIFTPYGKEYQIYLIAIACIMTSLGTILLVNTIANHIQTHKENQYLKLQHRYYSDLEQNQLEIRKIRHDMNNHLCTIGYLLGTNATAEAKDYFNTLFDQFPVSNRIFCPHHLLNAVIDSKYTTALNYEIDCTFNIEVNKLLPLDDIDLCSLFANTLDNAIEACLKIENPNDRRLVVKARLDKGYFSYHIVNTSITPIQMVNGKYISSKADKANHGLGLENIQEIVKKYHGMITISPTDHEFSILVMIPV